MIRVRLLLLLTASLPVLFAQTPSGQPQTAQPPSPQCESALCRLAASGRLSSLRWPDFSDYRTRIQSFYEPAGYALSWTHDGVATNQAQAVIEILEAAAAKGLNAEDYDGSRWAARLASLSRVDARPSEKDLDEFDLALTVSLMRYMSDLRLGRANPGLFRSQVDIETRKNDLPGFLRERVLSAPSVQDALNELEPPYEGYRRTEQALQRYLALAREDHGDLLPVTEKPVDPGRPYSAVAQLTDRLRRLGDLPEDQPVALESGIYAGPLVDAVKHFQMRHGLDVDGRIGKATLAQLNTPLIDRVRQLQLALERWRWVPRRFPRPPIVVNIPEFELRALDDSYKTELAMKVVVGIAYRHQTPVFMADMREVVFRPYWNVPLSIQRAELMPKLNKDASYLAANLYEVVTPQGAVVTDGEVDKATLAQLRAGKLHIRQIPGPKNALGLVAFMFPNPYDVYLHSTPATVLFARSRRDFSHGCIRAEKPEPLAEWVLSKQPGWTPQRIAEAMNGDKTLHVALDQPIPVLIVYATAVVLDSGEVRFFQDIYGLDDELAELLAKGYPYSSTAPSAATSGGLGPRPRE